MGLFDGLFSKGSKQESANAVESTTAGKISLEKRQETFKICLEKNNINTGLKASVVFVVDVSGSMDDLFDNGVVQDTFERILPVALQFDDDGTLDAYSFNTSYKELPSVTRDNYLGYVRKNIHVGGGTDYSPIITAITKKYASKARQTKVPVYVMIVTDGDCSNEDKARAERAIIEASKERIFFQFIGIGHAQFNFLDKLDNMQGRFVDNANLFKVKDLTKISDEELYDKLMAEFPSWLSEYSRKVD